MSVRPNPSTAVPDGALESDIPARLDRLPWTRFHWLFVLALGVTWVLDGLEVTVVGALGPALENPKTLGLSSSQFGVSQSFYLAGAITGALFFGYLTDRLGRKKLFTVTLLIYLAGAVLSALAWDFWSFALFRLVVGLAIGGEYAAINSAIDELIPARVRGRVDLAINGTFWLGAIAGAAVTVPLLNENLVPVWLGWRLSFGVGALIGTGMIIARQFVPESPRWLLTHGRVEEAEAVVRHIESHVPDPQALPPVTQRLTIYPDTEVGFGTIFHTLLVRYRSRAVLGLVLIASQAFFYNGISFSYPLVLRNFYHVPINHTGIYVVCMAVANLMGPLLLGHFFDTVGRRKMISGTYALSAVIIVGTELLFLNDRLTAAGHTALWATAFFFASAAASAGYLTVSEVFPVEMRALAIALFYAIGTAIGGLGAPALFGALLDTGSRELLFYGYAAGAGLMLLAAAVELLLGVASECKSLEDVATPLKAHGGAVTSPRRQPRPAAPSFDSARLSAR
jgi:MFS family permease